MSVWACCEPARHFESNWALCKISNMCPVQPATLAQPRGSAIRKIGISTQCPPVPAAHWMELGSMPFWNISYSGLISRNR